ncbi:MAG: GreA/GreB family elongation factor [Planctomycetes bacterium]|nr:GreA/GreB family elongation factor [Planctomycetota bacterium]
MPHSQLLQLVEAGDYNAFEARCLELLDNGAAQLADLAPSFESLHRAGEGGRAATLAQMVLEYVEINDDPRAALQFARIALLEDPKNDGLRALTLDLYKRAYADDPGFPALLEASGFESGRPARYALRLLDTCLALKKGDVLISRMDDHAAEVIESDSTHGLYTLRREGRVTTVPAAELVREYDPVDADDFRALRQLNPDRLTQVLQDDPVAVVIGILHTHGESLDAEVLKHDLVPRHIAAKDWSKWWTRTRNLLKRSPHVAIEGRSPMLLTYVPEGRTLEDEVWENFDGRSEPAEWVSIVEAYLREKTQRKEAPDPDLLERFQTRLLQKVEATRARRPAEALAGALAIDRLREKGLPSDAAPCELSAALLREAEEPAALVARLREDMFWDRGVIAMSEAFGEDAGRRLVDLIPAAPAFVLSRIVKIALKSGLVAEVQKQIERAVATPHECCELIYWLWKGPGALSGVQMPTADELFARILDTLSALGRTLNPRAETIRAFRTRMKAALALKNFAAARECLQRTDEARAVTVRRQLERMEGLGDNAPARLLDLLRDVHPALWVRPQKRVEPWEDPNVVWGTNEGLLKKTAQRDHLVNIEMRENAKRIGEAAEHGDLSENSEFKFAIEERDLLRARLAGINEMLSLARVLTAADVPEDQVGIGSRVTLRNTSDGSQQDMTFLGPFETDVDNGIYNYQSPVGLKLMGKRAGDRVPLPLDGGECEFEIVAFANGMAAE